MQQNIKKRTIGTHNGSFHADEVTACALLLVFGLADRSGIVRTRDPTILDTCEFVCDVGGEYIPEKKKFDHHQAEYQGSLSSAGMVLKYLLDSVTVSQEEYAHLNNLLVMGVDAHDNGVDLTVKGVTTYSHIIANFVPIEYEASDKEQDAAFDRALEFAMEHLKRLIERRRYILSFTSIVEAAMKPRALSLQFDQSIPWMDAFFALHGEEHPAQFVVMPSGENWKLRGIPPNSKEKMKVRKALPEEWAGLSDDDLAKASGIPGAIFCHKGRFFSLWKTKEDALKALELTIKRGS